MTRLLGFAVTMIAGLSFASVASADIACLICVRVCVDNGNGIKCTSHCTSTICPGAGSLKMPFAPNLSVREGSACTLKLKSSLATKSVQGSVDGHTCVLGHPLR
jgi:hypothetical protein